MDKSYFPLQNWNLTAVAEERRSVQKNGGSCNLHEAWTSGSIDHAWEEEKNWETSSYTFVGGYISCSLQVQSNHLITELYKLGGCKCCFYGMYYLGYKVQFYN